MPVCRHASLTLHVSASTPRNLSALSFDQSRFACCFSCGLRAATNVNSLRFANPPSPQMPNENGPHHPRMADPCGPLGPILHCAYVLPKQRDDVKNYFAYLVPSLPSLI